MNENRIVTGTWSNEASRALYEQGWPDHRELRTLYEEGSQCGGCSFFAPFNASWGLCANERSPCYLETVFEHYVCGEYAGEG
jgi:hypothetical protein